MGATIGKNRSAEYSGLRCKDASKTISPALSPPLSPSPSPSLLPDLSLGRPDALQVSIALKQAVHRVVGLTHGADEAGQGVDLVVASNGTAILGDLGNGNLDGGVVVGTDDAVGGAALAWNVTGAALAKIALSHT